jgi:hypothetical protein
MPTPFNCGLNGPIRIVLVRWPRIIDSRLAAKNPKALSDSVPKSLGGLPLPGDESSLAYEQTGVTETR